MVRIQFEFSVYPNNLHDTNLIPTFMITRLLIAFEDFLGSLIAPQVMPPCLHPCQYLEIGTNAQIKVIVCYETSFLNVIVQKE